MIRPALPNEATAVRALVRDAYGHYVERIGREPGPMNDDYGQRIAAGQTWVLEEQGAIRGIIVLEDRPDALLLYNVAVAPAAQGKGHGRQLIAFAEAEARRRGYDTVRLFTHERMVENIAIYTRLGFVETGRVEEGGFRRVYMERGVSGG